MPSPLTMCSWLVPLPQTATSGLPSLSKSPATRVGGRQRRAEHDRAERAVAVAGQEHQPRRSGDDEVGLAVVGDVDDGGVDRVADAAVNGRQCERTVAVVAVDVDLLRRPVDGDHRRVSVAGEIADGDGAGVLSGDAGVVVLDGRERRRHEGRRRERLAAEADRRGVAVLRHAAPARRAAACAGRPANLDGRVADVGAGAAAAVAAGGGVARRPAENDRRRSCTR